MGEGDVNDGQPHIAPQDVIDLLGALVARQVDVIKTENLCTFDGEQGFALGQGQ
jgi:isocitrate dehydrogenase